MLMALNTHNFDHKKAYGYDNIVMDADYSQVDRANIENLNNITAMVRFSYTENRQITIEKFENITVIESITTKDFDFKDAAKGVLFLGERISIEIVNKDSAAILYPKAFNKLGHFNQFTLKLT
ncbi:hypothetical protein VF_A0644 [Aliivibrio fischeri ES114]|uniref:Uncharacterized protein n=1 Tax=Aliivibrio fischeri (strain ATCC 700601 / ES114) TaxID=312309 RepID=Q5DZT2_ALIF1|nr:hypothetical protein [Aliivibrio fischeri]AAW87714.1 hypothetical protein VF_A0644 [Aliivibrio fischeri ES114]KLU78136.1 hypothetical protein AB192_13240 [Aliivibrio fischeri]